METTKTYQPHVNKGNGRSSREIEEDIRYTRDEMDETVAAIRARLQPERLAEYAIEGLSEAFRRDTGKRIVQFIKQNPMPTALAALGVGWFAYNNSETMQSKGHALKDKAEYGMAKAGEKASDAAYRSGEKTSGKFESAKLKARGKAHETKESLSGKARTKLHDARDRIGEAGSSTKSGISGAASRTGEGLSHAASRAGAATRQGASRAGHQIQRSYDEHPFAMGFMAMAVGAAAAILLPPTRREDEMMGAVRDEVLDTAKETGEAAVQGAMPHAEAAMDDISTHAGQAMEDVKKHGQELKEDLSKEARQAREDAKESMKQKAPGAAAMAEKAKESSRQGASSQPSQGSLSFSDTETESIPRTETAGPGSLGAGTSGFQGSSGSSGSSTFTNPPEQRAAGSDRDPLEDR